MLSTVSCRERLIEHVLSELRSLPSVKTVTRRLPGRRALEEFALTQFPVVAVVAGLPTPVGKRSDRRVGEVDAFISDLAIDLYVYDLESEGTDARVSVLANELWRRLYVDPTCGGLALGTTIGFSGELEYWDPFIAFILSIKTSYLHDKGGI
jgi:hypothetical protein